MRDAEVMASNCSACHWKGVNFCMFENEVMPVKVCSVAHYKSQAAVHALHAHFRLTL